MKIKILMEKRLFVTYYMSQLNGFSLNDQITNLFPFKMLNDLDGSNMEYSKSILTKINIL